MATKNADRILYEASMLNQFRSQIIWLIIISEPKVDLQAFDGLNITIDSDVRLAVPTTEGYDLFEIYIRGHDSKNGYLALEKIGKWTIRGGWYSQLTSAKYDRRGDLKGLLLNTAVVIVKKLKRPLIDYLLDDTVVSFDSVSSISYAFMLLFAAMFNFKIKLERTVSWGYLKNGTFDGMIGALQTGKAQIGISALYLKNDRMLFSEAYAETSYQKVIIIFRHPKGSGQVSTAFLTPLDSDVWLASAFALMLIMIALGVCLYLERKLSSHSTDNDGDRIWGVATLLVFGAICQQGPNESCRWTSARISIITTLLFSVLFYQFYSASIVSSLLQDSPKNIRTPEQLLRSNVRVKVQDIVYNRVFFETSTSTVVKEIYKKKVLKHGRGFLSSDEGLQMVKEGGCGFLLDIDVAYKVIQKTFTMREICDLSEIQLAPTYRLVSVVKKHSPYREMLSFGFRKLFERGIVVKENTRWHPSKPKCIPQLTQNVFRVGVKEISSAFIMLLCAMVFSITILFIEILIDKMKKRNIDRKNTFQ